MPFFPQVYLSPEANFLHLLSELDQPQQQKSCAPRHQPKRQQTFTPRFDVTEVADAYELFGEVPGLEQKDISIEFSDAQTLVIKGKTERSSSKAAPAAPVAAEETSEADSAKADAASNEKNEESHNPTVEDDYDEADTPLTTTTAPAPATDDAPAPAATQPQQQQQQQQPPRAKFWVAERRVGSFARSFSFEQRIEHDGVAAALRNGVLYVRVPKSLKPKRVEVSVL